MDSPPNNIQNEIPGRRTTRSALMEIPARMQTLTVNDWDEMNTQAANTGVTVQQMATLATPINGGRPGPGLWNVSLNLPSSLLSPSPSPDEMLIQARGRRRMPIMWSPDSDSKKSPTSAAAGSHGSSRTPIKSPTKSTIVLRSTPRKRLMMNDPKELFPTPEKRTKSPSAKRSRLETPGYYQGPLEEALKGLSQEQLIGVIEQLVTSSPHLAQGVKDSLPPPDLRPLEDRLDYLKKNIFKSLPNSRLTSKTDSPAYKRAAVHLSAFKKSVVEQGRRLVDSQHWNAVLDYVLMAWTYVKATPLWDNHAHNAARKQCFKSLVSQLMTAIKKGTFTEQQLQDLERKLEEYNADNEDVQACLNHLCTMRSTVK